MAELLRFVYARTRGVEPVGVSLVVAGRMGARRVPMRPPIQIDLLTFDLHIGEVY